MQSFQIKRIKNVENKTGMVSDLFGNRMLPSRLLYYLTWKPPFASLMLHKKKETRINYTSIRGDVLILAGKKKYEDHELFEMCGPGIMHHINETLVTEPTAELRGKAIAIGNLVDCRPMLPSDERLCFLKYKEPWQSIKNGKYVEQRLWVWDFIDVRRIEPFDFNGHQGWGTLKDLSVYDKIKFIE